MTYRLNEQDYAEIFAALSDPIRLRLLKELAGGERHVGELAIRVAQTVSRTSHHLRILLQKGLVMDRRDGRMVLYRLPSLSDQLDSHPFAPRWGGHAFEILSVLSATLTTITADPEPMTQPAATLHLAAASDLTHALSEVAALVPRTCGVDLRVTFGSTGFLASQIKVGVPIDLFAAARPQAVRDLTDQGLLLEEHQAIFARGRLVVWHRKDAPFMLSCLEDLSRPEVRWVSVADPSLAPTGAATREVFERSDLWRRLEDRLVLSNNSQQALEFAGKEPASAAVVPLSLSPGPTGHYVIVPAEGHHPLDQTIAVTARTTQREAAMRVVDFLEGPLARPIFKKYGFMLPDEY